MTLVLGLILAGMAVFGVGLFKRSTADFRGGTAQRERTLADPDYRIAAYDRFFDLCAAVQSSEATAASLEEELETKPSDARVEQIQASLTAVRANRAEQVNQYNADAAKAGTRAQFRASTLPYTLDVNAEVTTCVP